MNSIPKVAIVTGAGSGIGKRTALAFLEKDYSVALAGRRKEPLEKTAAESGSAGSRALVVPTDVANPNAVHNLFVRTKEAFGRIDVLFNNAGIFGPSVLFEDIPYEEWRAVVDTNLTGAFLCAREAFRIMRGQHPMGGRIINNGSISAHAPRPNSAPYTATKHAITGLTKSMSLDGRKYDIACCQIDIGNAATDLIKAILEDGTGATQADGSIATEPTMDLDHVARSIVHMASLPLDANVQFMTIMATKMPFIGRG
jgi:NAD(P)-dependent dehydrogenase (short-subunit alcohol dehydrogenase family)